MKTKALVLTAFLMASCSGGIPPGFFGEKRAPDGKTVFFNAAMGGCSACHAITDEKMLGPGLAGTSKKHTAEWLGRWIKNPQKVWAENSPETAEMKKRLGVEHKPEPGMKIIGSLYENDVEELVKYLQTL